MPHCVNATSTAQAFDSSGELLENPVQTLQIGHDDVRELLLRGAQRILPVLTLRTCPRCRSLALPLDTSTAQAGSPYFLAA